MRVLARRALTLFFGPFLGGQKYAFVAPSGTKNVHFQKIKSLKMCLVITPRGCRSGPTRFCDIDRVLESGASRSGAQHTRQALEGDAVLAQTSKVLLNAP